MADKATLYAYGFCKSEARLFRVATLPDHRPHDGDNEGNQFQLFKQLRATSLCHLQCRPMAQRQRVCHGNLQARQERPFL